MLEEQKIGPYLSHRAQNFYPNLSLEGKKWGRQDGRRRLASQHQKKAKVLTEIPGKAGRLAPEIVRRRVCEMSLI